MNNVRGMKRLLIAIILVIMVIPQSTLASRITGDTFQRTVPDRSKTDFKQGEIIFKTGGTPADELALLKRYKLSVKRWDSRLGYTLAATQTGADIERLVKDLQREEHVSHAQPNYVYRLFSKPNDPQYSRQWAIPKINAEQSLSIAKANAPVTVAILDSGVDVNHPDLKGRLVSGINTVNPLKSTRDDEGHGTHVAGIVAAGKNNGIGVTGVAGIPGIKVMPVKVFDKSGGSDISISDGIIWAVDHGAKVMNMSFGSFYQSPILNDAIDYAYSKGVVMVAAAGNWASEEISYPAALSKVMAVSAIDKNDKLADFSSFGPQIDVCAPGAEIYSTFWDPYKGSTYTELSGTSMASPMVASLAALLLAQNPRLTNDEVRQIIEVSATDLGDPGWDPQFGHGRINVFKALTISLTRKDDTNSTRQKAIYLQHGVPYREKISSGNDIDWYKVNVPDKGHLQVEVLPAGKVSPGIEIYDSTDALVSSFNTPNLEPETAFDPRGFASKQQSIKVAQKVYGLVNSLDEGEYYVKVFGNHFRWSEENYTITARIFPDTGLVKDPNEPNGSVEEAKSIEVGKEISGAILKSGEDDWFKVNLAAGKAYKFHLSVPEGLDLAVDIESEVNYMEPKSEEEMAAFDDRWFWETVNSGDQGQDDDGVIALPENGGGLYYIRVYDNAGFSVNGNYTLTITPFDFKADKYEPNDLPEQAATVNIGETVTANFDTQEDEDWYSVKVQSTGILKINLKQPAKTICRLELYSDPTKEPEGTSILDFGSGPDLSQLSGLGQAKQTFAFKVMTGKYYIRINNYGNVSADNYAFDTELSDFDFVDSEINDTPSKANEITLNSTKQGTIYPERDVDFYALDVDKAQSLLVYLTPPADLNTTAVVLKEMDQDGADDGGNKGRNGIIDGIIDVMFPIDRGTPGPDEPLLEPVAEINSGGKGDPDTGVFVASKPGRYYILIAAGGDSQGNPANKSTGKYSLVVKPFKVQPDAWEYNGSMDRAKPLAAGLPVKPTFMGIEDVDWFKFYMPAKGKLGVTLTVPSDIDGVLEIYDSAGKLLTKIDESMVGEEESVLLPIANRGYYFIKAYDYLGNSSVQTYTLTARYVK